MILSDPKVFLSYTQRDPHAPQVAEQLRDGLRNSGVLVIDAQSFSLGEPIASAIESAISGSDVVITIVADDTSPWVEFEAAAALANGKRLIPIFLGPAGRLGRLFKGQVGVQIDATNRSQIDAAIKRIINAVREPLPDTSIAARRIEHEASTLHTSRLAFETGIALRSRNLSRISLWVAVVTLITAAVSLFVGWRLTEIPGDRQFSEFISTAIPAILAGIATVGGYFLGRRTSSTAKPSDPGEKGGAQ